MTDYHKAYYQKNKEKIKARIIAYRKANHARDRARDQAYKAKKRLKRANAFYTEEDQKRVEGSLKYNHGNEMNYHYRRVARYEERTRRNHDVHSDVSE